MATTQEAPWLSAVDTAVRQVSSAFEDGDGRITKVLMKHRKDPTRWSKKTIDRTMKRVNKELALMRKRVVLGLEKGAELAVGSVKGPKQDISGDIAKADAQFARMKAQVREAIVQDARQINREAKVRKITKRVAAKDLTGSQLGRGLQTNFVDRAGKKWKTDVYLEVLADGSARNAALNALQDKMAEEGQNLVMVAGPAGGCPKCAPWVGMILSLVGGTDYPTVDEAMGQGLFHPRCRHHLVPYKPEKKKKD